MFFNTQLLQKKTGVVGQRSTACTGTKVSHTDFAVGPFIVPTNK